MDNRKKRIFATLIGAIGVVLWATETSLVTYTTGIPPLETVAIAFVFAALLSPVVWLLTGESPFVALRQPPSVWALTVGSLVAYHASIYYATQKAPPAAAALLQGTTPLMIVIGSALLPGERLRWWHVVGVVLGLAGVLRLIDTADGDFVVGAGFYLALIGIAAALWGAYSILSRALPDVPSSALGMFYAASAMLSFGMHFSVEEWVQPTPDAWLAMAALGIFPMGLAIYLWDFGMKRGDVQALGALSYIEPLIGALLVVLFAGGVLELSLLWSGTLVVGGALIASASLWIPRDYKPLVGPETLKQAGIDINLVDAAILSQFERQAPTANYDQTDLRRALDQLRETLNDWRRAIKDEVQTREVPRW
jgi:drug/metabolite transporter (DMT)-like permease